MELNMNLIGVQGVLTNCLKNTGEFTRINYKGGNEQNISYITTELEKFLTTKGFLKDSRPVEQFRQELNEIVFFLALNTAFKKSVIRDEYSHLLNIIPQLSKCLLANICFTLNLTQQYGFVIEKFPLDFVEELLDQMVECLRKAKPKKHLNNAITLLRSVANKLSTTEMSCKTEDTVEDIVGIVNIILSNILTLSSEDAKKMSEKNVFIHTGYTLLNLFELLLYIDPNIPSMKSFAKGTIRITCSVFEYVTLNVFCAWAEINYNDQPLQIYIAGKAYLVIEKYQQLECATQLRSMLMSIARKPKTLSELILEADISTIIKKVDENNANQKVWFNALLKTAVFTNVDIVSCIDRWWTLCDTRAVDRLLTVPLPNDQQQRQLIVKCASNISMQDLCRLLKGYFHREKFLWNEEIQDKITMFFNHLHPDLSEDERKELFLLLLQNTRLFFKHFYLAAFKSSLELKEIFNLVIDIAKIDDIGGEVLMEVFSENPTNIQTIMSYIKLFDTMLQNNYYSWEYISNILLRLLEKYRNDGCSEEFCYCLKIFKHYSNLSCAFAKEMKLLQIALMSASENRWKSFVDFTSIKEDTTHCCVEYVLKKSEYLENVAGKDQYFSDTDENMDDPWVNYYKNVILNRKEKNLLDYLLPNFDLNFYRDEKRDDNFTKLLKILPRCVTIEWKMLVREVESKCGFPVTINALTDVVILLCEITENQVENQGTNVNEMLLILKSVLQNYGQVLQLEARPLDDQVLAINNICRVLRYMPELLKTTEGMNLINAMPNGTLSSLAQDKEFVAKIVLINDKQICQVLARKVLGIN